MALVLCIILIVGAAIGGTVAWLTATSEKVTNTFTVGDIDIKLEEHSDGTSSGTVVTSRTDIKILPGSEVAKDPFVTVLKGSEKCYVYAAVTNNLKIGDTTVATLTLGSDWTAVGTKGDLTLYKYSSVVDAASADQVLAAVFTKVTIADTVTSEQLPTLEGKTIEIQAYAHQSENTTEAVATAAAKAQFGIS